MMLLANTLKHFVKLLLWYCVCVRRGSVGISPQSAAVYADAASDPAESKLAADDSPADPPEQSTTTSGQPVMCALFSKIHLIFSHISVKSVAILNISATSYPQKCVAK